jgi:hypothetical protein
MKLSVNKMPETIRNKQEMCVLNEICTKYYLKSINWRGEAEANAMAKCVHQ